MTQHTSAAIGWVSIAAAIGFIALAFGYWASTTKRAERVCAEQATMSPFCAEWIKRSAERRKDAK